MQAKDFNSLKPIRRLITGTCVRMVGILAGLGLCGAGHAQTLSIAPTQDPATPPPWPIRIAFDAEKVMHQMAGGMGASWHAIREESPRGDRGSAWGANPPLENAKAWAQVEKHASWLGLDWIRVEIDQRMYEPARGKFDWDNPEMKTLYRILDWCQSHHADVFLQQMWSHVAWNAHAGVDPLFSAPRSMDDFVEGITTLVDHLVNTKGYTCIRWLAITNEPESKWSLWRDAKGHLPIAEGLHAVRKGLDAKGLHLPLAGPDWSFCGFPKLPPERLTFDSAIGAYEIHCYWGMGGEVQSQLAHWTEWAHQRNKPFFLGEYGNFGFSYGGSAPGPRTYGSVLSNADTILRGLAVGVDGFNRWSFLNRGDLDGQWQLVRTWDVANQRYLENPIPEPTIYHGFGIISRLAAKHSEVLACEMIDGPGPILTGALRSPKGNLTFYLVNFDCVRRLASVQVKGLKSPVAVYPYEVTETALLDPAFALRPEKPITLSGASKAIWLPPFSITALTTYCLQPEDPGIIEDVKTD